MLPEAQLIANAALVVVSLVGAYTDLRWRRLPNWLTLGSAVLGLALGLLSRGLDGGRESLVGWLLGCGMLFLFFAIGAVGAGDVKLLGAVGALRGTRFVFISFVYMALVGGVLAIALLAYRGELLPMLRGALRWMWLSLKGLFLYRALPSLGSLLPEAPIGSAEAGSGPKGKRLTLPYGVAIAAGTIIALLMGY